MGRDRNDPAYARGRDARAHSHPRDLPPRREIRPIPIEGLAPTPEAETLIAQRGERAAEIREKLTAYLKLLLETNQLFNLTGDTQPEKQWRAHLEDALLNAGMMERANGRPMESAAIADVGSGGGMPGIVWAILWPGARVTLIEATEKKAGFLRKVGERLGLSNLTVLGERAEVVGHARELRESFDWVTARALADLGVAIEWLAPLCKIGGRIAFIKGAEIGEELRAARRANRLLGVTAEPVIEEYGRSDGKKCKLVLLQKSERTPSPYPRRVGVASQNPL